MQNKTSIQWTPGSQVYLSKKKKNWSKVIFEQKQVKLMWTPEALSLFMLNHLYLDSRNDVEIYNALKNYSRL